MRRTTLAGLAGLGVIGMLAGCQADFMADVRNNTPQPLFARLHIKSNNGRTSTLGAQRRLGPGDRAFVGPVRAAARPGQVYLVVDTLGNPNQPSTHDLTPGTTFVDVGQGGDEMSGPLRLTLKPPAEPSGVSPGVVPPGGKSLEDEIGIEEQRNDDERPAIEVAPR